MSPELVGGIGIGVMLLLMFLGLPIAVCMASVGLAGYAVLCGVNKALLMVGMVPYSTIASYVLSVLPVYLLMGEFADVSGLMRDSYRAANTWLGNLPGGLAMASIVGAALFSAVSGSSMACAAIMTRIVAALIPGVVLTLMYLIQIYIQCKINPSLGPRGGRTTWKHKLFGMKDIVALTIVFALVMGGIWFGVFTATEAGAIGTIFTFLFALLRRKLTRQNLIQTLKNTINISGMAFAIIIGAQIFTFFITVSGLSQELAQWVTDLKISPIGVVIWIMIIYFVLGTAMDTITMILLTL
ncbi:MAG: C4-dicarboxylate transporter permease, partial [Deltaproteobacteria bacterium]|nr:C4-dicarboxylate transporter permease [Deltaproteobacteria bacterium]